MLSVIFSTTFPHYEADLVYFISFRLQRDSLPAHDLKIRCKYIVSADSSETQSVTTHKNAKRWACNWLPAPAVSSTSSPTRVQPSSLWAGWRCVKAPALLTNTFDPSQRAGTCMKTRRTIQGFYVDQSEILQFWKHQQMCGYERFPLKCVMEPVALGCWGSLTYLLRVYHLEQSVIVIHKQLNFSADTLLACWDAALGVSVSTTHSSLFSHAYI